MKTFFLLLGSWAVIIITIIIGSVIYDHFKSSKYDDTAVPYLERVIPILSQWDAENIRRFMAPEALERIPDKKYRDIIKLFSKMGTLQNLDTPKFSKIQDEGGNGKVPIIEYTADAKYINGDALITINLLYKEGQLKIYHFNLSSKTLLE